MNDEQHKSKSKIWVVMHYDTIMEVSIVLAAYDTKQAAEDAVAFEQDDGETYLYVEEVVLHHA